MKTPTTHPHKIMAGFVNDYEKFILPALNEGKLNEDTNKIISNATSYFYDEIQFFLKFANPKTCAKYGMSLINLDILREMVGTSGRGLSGNAERGLSGNVERGLKELDAILHEDPYYKLNRETLK